MLYIQANSTPLHLLSLSRSKKPPPLSLHKPSLSPHHRLCSKSATTHPLTTSFLTAAATWSLEILCTCNRILGKYEHIICRSYRVCVSMIIYCLFISVSCIFWVLGHELGCVWFGDFGWTEIPDRPDSGPKQTGPKFNAVGINPDTPHHEAQSASAKGRPNQPIPTEYHH